MSAPVRAAHRDAPGATLRTGATRFGTIVVVGGGCYGSYYVRQLARAAKAGAVAWRRLVVVDRDANCGVTKLEDFDAELVVSEWSEFFTQYLGAWGASAGSDPTDAVVPSPLMPHLMYEWIRDRCVERWPDRSVLTRPLSAPPPTPWQRASADGTHYVSFAEWTCPVNCIEPGLCPHTRGERTWSMPIAVREYVNSERSAGRELLGPFVFHCTHRAFGVGMVDVADVVAAESSIRSAAEAGAVDALIGTVSHCHGALNLLSIR